MGDPALNESPRGTVDPWAVIDALPRAIVVTSTDGRIMHWNSQAEELYGWRCDEVLGRDAREVLGPIHDRALADEIRATVASGRVWSGDFTVHRRDGTPVRIWVMSSPVRDLAGRVVASVAASEDIAEQRLLEQRAAELTEHLRLALDAGGLGTFRWDMATGTTRWDEKLEALFGLPPGGFDGQYETWVGLLHPDDRDEVLRTIDAAVEAKSSYEVEHRVIWPDGSLKWLHGAGQVTLDEAGNVTGTIGCTSDVTQRVLDDFDRSRLAVEAVAAAEQERIHRERLQFLSAINDALAAASNVRELMENVTRAAVPRLGDWCSLYVLPEQGLVPEIETAHFDPAMAEYARELQAQFPYDPDSPTGMAEVIRTGTSQFIPYIDDELIASFDAPAEALDVVRRLQLRSSIAVPLVKRNRVLGGLQLVMSEAGRRYTQDDLTLAEAVAARIAASLVNLRLSDAQRSIASALQASLLPARLPAIPGVEVAVRYWATGDGVEVGGDFYDLFAISADEWAVVIGDVCGTGPVAAAVTSMARHTIGSAAWHGDDHVTVLENLNQVMLARESERYCTVLYGTLAPADGGATFTFVCGGHPHPVVVRADGAASLVGRSGTVVGVFDDIDASATTVVLGPGDSVVLYTDGVTDVAPPHGVDDQQLVAMVRDAAGHATTAEGLADRLEAQLSQILPFEQRHDDVAVLVIRIPHGPQSG